MAMSGVCTVQGEIMSAEELALEKLNMLCSERRIAADARKRQLLRSRKLERNRRRRARMRSAAAFWVLLVGTFLFGAGVCMNWIPSLPGMGACVLCAMLAGANRQKMRKGE